MSILIKGMDMPKSCDECGFCDNDRICVILGDDLFDRLSEEVAEHIRYFPDDWKCDACPLVELPTPHGRLIDADDAIIDADERGYDFWVSDTDVNCAQDFLREQATVIKAEE